MYDIVEKLIVDQLRNFTDVMGKELFPNLEPPRFNRNGTTSLDTDMTNNIFYWLERHPEPDFRWTIMTSDSPNYFRLSKEGSNWYLSTPFRKLLILDIADSETIHTELFRVLWLLDMLYRDIRMLKS